MDTPTLVKKISSEDTFTSKTYKNNTASGITFHSIDSTQKARRFTARATNIQRLRLHSEAVRRHPTTARLWDRDDLKQEMSWESCDVSRVGNHSKKNGENYYYSSQRRGNGTFLACQID